MATKKTPAVSADAQEAPAVAVATVTYRDKVFTSRTLILPSGAALAIAKGAATVPASDTDAVAFLDTHADFEKAQE